MVTKVTSSNLELCKIEAKSLDWVKCLEELNGNTRRITKGSVGEQEQCW